MLIEFLMSCGHTQTKDCATTEEQLRIDMRYYKTQGLCDECWRKLRERREAEREELRKAKGAKNHGESD